MYHSKLPIEKNIVENLYQYFNWKRIWSNFCGLKIRYFDKEIIYKLICTLMAMLIYSNIYMKKKDSAHQTDPCNFMQYSIPAKYQSTILFTLKRIFHQKWKIDLIKIIILKHIINIILFCVLYFKRYKLYLYLSQLCTNTA